MRPAFPAVDIIHHPHVDTGLLQGIDVTVKGD
ncbi:Uncharacterised protein [Serratia plymuthica]|uniref:Uncharacterized protein n=1 Tax=Serratia plymuthica TaxID=82996 RepID=A0A2X4V2H8_SERPL|nr:Uncharacterised protein [Serratia plymuthica]